MIMGMPLKPGLQSILGIGMLMGTVIDQGSVVDVGMLMGTPLKPGFRSIQGVDMLMGTPLKPGF